MFNFIEIFVEHAPCTLFGVRLAMTSAFLFLLAFGVRLAFVLHEKMTTGRIERDNWKLSEPRLMRPFALYVSAWLTFFVSIAIPILM